jgi:3-hydroxyisobutyrate dehydrogenase
MAKDVGLAVSAANTIRAPLPLGSNALQLYLLHSRQGNGNKDFASIYEFFSKQTKK